MGRVSQDHQTGEVYQPAWGINSPQPTPCTHPSQASRTAPPGPAPPTPPHPTTSYHSPTVVPIRQTAQAAPPLPPWPPGRHSPQAHLHSKAWPQDALVITPAQAAAAAAARLSRARPAHLRSAPRAPVKAGWVVIISAAAAAAAALGPRHHHHHHQQQRQAKWQQQRQQQCLEPPSRHPQPTFAGSGCRPCPAAPPAAGRSAGTPAGSRARRPR